MEQGWERSKAAAFAYTSTAGPMLSGTLVTVAGFLPIATAQSSTGRIHPLDLPGERHRAAGLVAGGGGGGALSGLAAARPARAAPFELAGEALPAPRAPQERIGLGEPHYEGDEDEVFRTPFYNRFRALVDACVARRWWVIAPRWRSSWRRWWASFRAEAVLPQLHAARAAGGPAPAGGASLRATQAEVEKLEAILDCEPGVANYVAYVGTGSRASTCPRPAAAGPNFAQFVVLTRRHRGPRGPAEPA